MYHAAFFVAELAEDDEDEVNGGPDAEAAHREDHEDAGADLPHVEAVDAEKTKEATEERGGETELR